MAIWNRSKSKKSGSGSKPTVAEQPRAKAPASAVPQGPELFRIGKTMRLKGELVGSIDVEIQGVVEGRVQVEEHLLVIAEGGRAMAEVSAREVVVRGQVVGNVKATERIVVETSGVVMGDICAPSIQLDDGSRFTGTINREAEPAKVTGQLRRDVPEKSAPRSGENSQALVRRQLQSDRRGDDRPWGDQPTRRSSSGEPEPAPTA